MVHKYRNCQNIDPKCAQNSYLLQIERMRTLKWKIKLNVSKEMSPSPLFGCFFKSLLPLKRGDHYEKCSWWLQKKITSHIYNPTPHGPFLVKNTLSGKYKKKHLRNAVIGIQIGQNMSNRLQLKIAKFWPCISCSF